MFWNRHKIKRDMIPKISFSSRASLKKEALLLAKGDVEYATKIYNFLAQDMDDIPTYDVIPPTAFENVKNTASQIFGWVKDNKDDILQGIDMLRSLKKGGGSAPLASMPPKSPLPKI